MQRLFFSRRIYLISQLYFIRSESRFQLMSNETRSFNEPVIYTSSIVYATESRSFLPTLREAYRRFKRARSIINLSWDRFLRAAFDRKPIARRGRLPSKSSECSCSRGSWRGKHKSPSKTTFVSRDAVKVGRNLVRWI